MATASGDLGFGKHVSRVLAAATFLMLTFTSAFADWNGDGSGPWGTPDVPPWATSPWQPGWGQATNPNLWQYNFKMNCVEAAQALRRFGYTPVNQVRCTGNTYTFIASSSQGGLFKVKIDPWSGQLISAKPAD